MPQAPQFCPFVVRSTHSPLQSVVPDGHAHAPPLHTRLPAQTCWQKPQLVLSFCRSTQVLPHLARPEPQDVAHAPALHTFPRRQRLPQLPQLALLVCRFTQVFPHCE